MEEKKLINPIIEEEWYDVERERVKGRYQVSNLGRVRNTSKHQILKPDPINSGYYVYKLFTGAYRKLPHSERYDYVLGHRLVMETIHPVENMDKLIVNHKDHNKHNNIEENLEWMTHSENNEDSLRYHKNYGEKRKDTKFNNDQLRIIDRELKKGTPYKEILSMIGMEDTWNNRDLVGNIKRGITYKKAIEDLNNE